jgi:hypothetical protein
MYRKFFLIICFVIILLLPGCFIKALHPFYLKDDVIFDDIFLGQWYDQDSSRWQILQQQGSKGFLKGDTLYPAYRVRLSEDGSQDDFIVHMFKIDKATYLDFYPDMNNQDDKNTGLFVSHIIPTHTLARFYKTSDSLIYVKWFNEEWLEMLFEQRRIKIAHEKVKQGVYDKAYVLTAGTDELYKFILKYGQDPNAFKATWEAKPEDQDKEDFTIVLRKSNETKN